MSVRRPRRAWRWLAACVVVMVLAFGAFAWWFLNDDAPAEVSIAAATEQVVDATASGATTGIDGTWTVDTSIGEFSYEESTGTFVGFRVAEELSGIGSTTAVGRTPDVTGSSVIDSSDGTATIVSTEIAADITAVTTNDSRRDDRALSALGASEFPTATFTLLDPIELPDTALAGEPATVVAHGELTIHGVTQVVDVTLTAQLAGETIAVVGTLDVVFADYGVSVPSAPIVVSAEDHGVIELQLFLTR